MSTLNSRLCATVFAATLALATGAAAQQGPEVAPGLSLPSASSMPWALDTVSATAQLVPIHHSTVSVDNHRGSNLARGMLFAKQKMNTQLDGLHSTNRIHTTTPAFFVPNFNDDPGHDKPGTEIQWAIVQAQPSKDHRLLQQVSFTAVTNNATRQEGVIPIDTAPFAGTLLRITPKQPLPPGEYALIPLTHTQNAFAAVVYDFAIDPTAAESPAALKPTP